MRRPELTRRRLVVALAVVAAIAFRCAIVLTYHKPAGDGMQYFQLAQELRHENRFAFGPAPAPPSYARLPGYPLFLAYVALPGKPRGLEPHLRAATLWNVAFDALTALCLVGIVRRLGLSRPWIAAVCVLAWPTLWLMSCFALTESLSILCAAAETYLAIRLWQEPRVRLAVAAGAIAGVAQLVRFDMLCVAPTVILAIAYGTRAWKRRLVLWAAFAGVALVVFAPWPIRNLVRFGRPYVAATQWRMATGKPLLDGPVQWARTWADSAVGDSYFELYFVYGQPIQIERPGIIKPKLYDSDAERQRLIAIYRDYNAFGLDDKVDGEFRALAADRARAHPLRTFVTLPLLRVWHLFVPEPDYEMPMHVPWLGLPTLRPLFGVVDTIVCLLALAAFFVARRSPLRPVLVLCGVQVLARFCVFAFAIPQATTQRYLVEAFPALLVLALITTSRLRRARATAA